MTVADAYVVDTGVFLRWFIDQEGFERARELQQKLLDRAVTAETVDFARAEVAGVLRKKGFLAGRLTLEEFTAAVRAIDDIGVAVHPTTADRRERAAELSARRMLGMLRRAFCPARAGARPAVADQRREARPGRQRNDSGRVPASRVQLTRSPSLGVPAQAGQVTVMIWPMNGPQAQSGDCPGLRMRL